MRSVPQARATRTPSAVSVGVVDVVAEAWLAPSAGLVVHDAVVEDLDKVAPQDLDVTTRELGGDGGEGLPGLVDEHRVGGPRAPPEDLVPDAEVVECGEVGAAPEVDSLAPAAQAGGPLDDGDLVPVTGEPVGESQAGDAGAGDQGGRGVHGASLRRCDSTM